ncbi:MAG: hypothetical protein SWZ49_13300 [Cyanobacteriota bacterium]|nr:hypothetical protein [Cyanobacteriota bacterium]
MDGLKQLVIQIQKSPPQTRERQKAIVILVEKILRPCSLFRCSRNSLDGVYLDIYQALQQHLYDDIALNIDKYQLKNFSIETWISELRNSAFQIVINESIFQQLALEIQKYQPLTKEWQYGFRVLTNAILLSDKLLHKTNIYHDIYEEAKNELWIWLYQNIHAYNPSKGKFSSWLNFRFDMILREKYRVENYDPFIQKLNVRIIKNKYRLANTIKNINQEKLNFWLTLQIKKLLPYIVGSEILFFLTVNFSISQLIITNPLAANSLLYEMVKQSLPTFTKLTNADDEIEKIPQVGSEKSLSEQLRQYLETDPHQLLQKHIRAHPEATFQFIVLKRLEGMSWQKLSDTLNIGIPALSNFFQRNLQKIAPEIRKHIQE